MSTKVNTPLCNIHYYRVIDSPEYYFRVCSENLLEDRLSLFDIPALTISGKSLKKIRSYEKNNKGFYQFESIIQETEVKDWFIGSLYTRAKKERYKDFILFYIDNDKMNMVAALITLQDKINQDEKLALSHKMIPLIEVEIEKYYEEERLKQLEFKKIEEARRKQEEIDFWERLKNINSKKNS